MLAFMFKTNVEKEDATVHKLAPSGAHFSSIINKRGKRLVKICVASAVLVILICGIILGIVIYNTGLDKVHLCFSSLHKKFEISTLELTSKGKVQKFSNFSLVR